MVESVRITLRVTMMCTSVGEPTLSYRGRKEEKEGGREKEKPVFTRVSFQAFPFGRLRSDSWW